MNLTEVLGLEPYSLNKDQKEEFFSSFLSDLTEKHHQNCQPYASILDGLSFDVTKKVSYKELPFLPVRLFKDNDFYSVDKSELIKTMTSSGTSGQGVSKIYLDKNTSQLQTKALVKIMSSYIGKSRVPMIIIDSPNVLKNRNSFSARGAGILGFSMFGTKKMYAFDENMKLNIEGIKEFLEEHSDKTILCFGFTYIIFKNFIKNLSKGEIDLSNGVLIHGGGWKKLHNESISNSELKTMIQDTIGLKSVHDYYGMVEQTGSINVECEHGYLHSSNLSDIIIRDPKDFSIMKFGEKGLVQTISILPHSYPGHSLLTEDVGSVFGIDDCKCGRKGTYFKIYGRLSKAELRGCSDVL